MKIFELRGFLKERGVRGFSMMKKSELEAKVQKLKEREKAEKYEENLRDTARMRSLSGAAKNSAQDR